MQTKRGVCAARPDPGRVERLASVRAALADMDIPGGPEAHEPRGMDEASGVTVPGGALALALCPGLHEWFAAETDRSEDARSSVVDWLPPMGLLIELAWQALESPDTRDKGRSGGVVWIGRRCWPYPPALVRRGGSHGEGGDRIRGGEMLARSVFVDPSSRAEAAWAIETAARSEGAAIVVGDGAGLPMAVSRRLQLASVARGTPVLLARPDHERRTLSAARTRWRVTHRPSDETARAQEWVVELLRCKGLRPWAPEGAGNARRWAVRRDHGASAITISAIEDNHPRPHGGGAPGDGHLAPLLADRPPPPARARHA